MNHLTGIRVNGGTVQTERADERQQKNSAGGYTFTVTPLQRIDRFLILGSDSSFYNGAAELSRENAQCIVDYLSHASVAEQELLVQRIKDVSVAGRAPKQSPALFALALVISQTEYDSVKAVGYGALNEVCRTASTLFEFFGYLSQFQRFGMGARKAIARWYNARGTDSLAYQMTKYRSRAGFTHADLLRLSKLVKSSEHPSESRAELLNWAVGKPYDLEQLPKQVRGLELAKHGTPTAESVKQLLEDYSLSWEMLPSEALSIPETWKILIYSENLPMGAMVRNLGRMSALGVFQDRHVRGRVLSTLARASDIRHSRLHPLNLLVAAKTHESGRGLKGSLTWTPDGDIVEALYGAVQLAYGNVEPSKSRMLYALDVSGSMHWDNCAGAPITPAEAAVMLASVTEAVEEQCTIVAFSHRIEKINLAGRTIRENVRAIATIPMGRTDIAQPMLHAIENDLKVDTFVVVTDNETYAGYIHPYEALRKYREHSGIDAKLVVLATTATSFTVADPSDAGMLDIAGLDLSTPQLISEFARGL